MIVRPLSGTGYSDDALLVEQSKEMFAHFGLAVHASNILETAVLNALFAAELGTRILTFRNREEWEGAYDAFYKNGLMQTFGKLVRRISAFPAFTQNLIDTLFVCKDVRNNLVHHMQRDAAEMIYSDAGRGELIASYLNAVRLFEVTSEQVERELHNLFVAIGVDTDMLARRIEDDMRRLVATAN